MTRNLPCCAMLVKKAIYFEEEGKGKEGEIKMG
jgi:hypothetical protein